MSAFLTVVGQHDDTTIAQARRCLEHDDAVRGALCADGHLGYSQPVGCAVAYREHVSVSGVGYDIACGNLAVQTDMSFYAIRNRVPAIATQIASEIPFGVGRTNAEWVDHPLFDDLLAWQEADALDLRQKAQAQLGTVGSGNHYVDLFRDAATDLVWIGVHFGSRGLGHTLATKYLKLGGGKNGINEPPTLLHQHSDIGRAYIAAMSLAGRYAYAGREWVAAKVMSILGASERSRVHNHHNFAWREEVDGAAAWVVRKGCTPAFPGQQGFVGGSMGDNAVILEGAARPTHGLMYSTVHGAGRVLGRRDAKRTLKREDMDAWLDRADVVLRGGDLDESPMAYRRLSDVLAAHAEDVVVTNTLRPVAVVMAGSDVRDPYKD